MNASSKKKSLQKSHVEILKEKIEHFKATEEPVDILHHSASPYRNVKSLGCRECGKNDPEAVAEGWMLFAPFGPNGRVSGVSRIDPVTGEPIIPRLPLYVVEDVVPYQPAATPARRAA